MSQDVLKLYQALSKQNQLNQDPNSSRQVNSPINPTPNQGINASNNKLQINYLNMNINDLKTMSTTNTQQQHQQSVQHLIVNAPSIQQANEFIEKRQREKCNKGLRHFSMKVCEKVKQKRVTSYSQVADELVNEYCNNSTSVKGNTVGVVSGGGVCFASIDLLTYDQKNVRRRVYDALNVLMAMNIISKEKKEIKWIGLPYNKKQELEELEVDKVKKQAKIKEKSEILKSLLIEQIAMKSLIERKKNQNSAESIDKAKIYLPFVALTTDPSTSVECTISTDKKDYMLQFDNTFQMSSHIDVLKKLGFTHNIDVQHEETETKISESDIEKASQMLPIAFRPYVKQMAENKSLAPICFDKNLPSYNKLLKKETNKVLKSSSVGTTPLTQSPSKNKSSARTGSSKVDDEAGHDELLTNKKLKTDAGATQSDKNESSFENENDEDEDTNSFYEEDDEDEEDDLDEEDDEDDMEEMAEEEEDDEDDDDEVDEVDSEGNSNSLVGSVNQE